MYLLLVYLDTKNRLILVVLGISLYILAFFEPSPFVTGILFIGILIHSVQQKKVSGKELFSIVMISTISFFATYLFFVMFFSFNLLQAFQYILKDAVGFNTEAERSYSIWIPENIKEFFYGAGLPVIMIFIYLVIKIFSEWKLAVINVFNMSMKNMYILSLLLTFCIVLLLGINRGETTRLWIYLAVFFQIPTAFFMAKTVKSNLMFFILAGTLIVQSIIELQMVGFIIPYI